MEEFATFFLIYGVIITFLFLLSKSDNNDLKKRISDNIKYNIELENKINRLKLKTQEIQKENTDLKNIKKVLEEREEMLLSLPQYQLNNTMLELFEEYTTKRFEQLYNYFSFKKNPSYKSAHYVAEIKQEFKQLEKENRELKLILSQFYDEETEKIENEKQENIFDTEKQAFNYSKISKEIWDGLNYIEKLDVVLEKYISSWKNKLNIGLEFERFCGYNLEKSGYSVKYWGILKGKADGGIDLIATKKNKILYVQCKYWGNSKTIRENTISQLFGASFKMALDNKETYESFIDKIKSKKIEMALFTKTELSQEAKDFCDKLNIKYIENVTIEDYPRVKTIEGTEKIFYIPSDLQYDKIIVNSTSKKYGRVYSCLEANQKGYRHCFKWRGNE